MYRSIILSALWSAWIHMKTIILLYFSGMLPNCNETAFTLHFWETNFKFPASSRFSVMTRATISFQTPQSLQLINYIYRQLVSRANKLHFLIFCRNLQLFAFATQRQGLNWIKLLSNVIWGKKLFSPLFQHL